MDLQPTGREKSERYGLDALLDRALLLDLEVSHHGRILKLGAVLGDLKIARSGSASIETLSEELNQLASKAECLLGHNVIGHDLPVLRERAPELALHRLPVIDTLVLSPICFPENPYHRLVKDYKLVRESINDPVADARQAASLFADEFQSLDGLRQKEPRLFAALHFLVSTPDQDADQLAAGMEVLFGSLGGLKPSKVEALDICREAFRRWGCAATPVNNSLVTTT